MKDRAQITFFYYETSNYQQIFPVAEEMERRGYSVRVTDNRFEKANVGVYSDHYTYYFRSKKSVIMLHDLGQRRDTWPSFWSVEPWSRYDLGILPGPFWERMWRENKGDFRSLPKKGMIIGGWPKADLVLKKEEEAESIALEFKERYHLEHDFTVLYAPSWSSVKKQEDVICALKGQKINVLLKEYPYEKEHTDPEIYQEFVKATSPIYEKENIHVINPKEPIMNCLLCADLVISDGSNVMTEAAILEKPSVIVMDWEMPKQSGATTVECAFDFFIKCRKDEIETKVLEIKDNYSFYKKQVISAKKDLVSCFGVSAVTIADAIEKIFFNVNTNVELLRSPSPRYSFLNWVKYHLLGLKTRMGFVKWSFLKVLGITN